MLRKDYNEAVFALMLKYVSDSKPNLLLCTILGGQATVWKSALHFGLRVDNDGLYAETTTLTLPF